MGTLENSEDQDEMSHTLAFHQGLHFFSIDPDKEILLA